MLIIAGAGADISPQSETETDRQGRWKCKLNPFIFSDACDKPSAGSAVFQTSHKVLKTHFTNFLDMCHIFLQLLWGKNKSSGF